jgi:transposase
VGKRMNRNRNRDLTDEQWEFLDSLIREPTARRDGHRTGAPWFDLPERYPSYQTCHRRFQQWVRSGIMRGVLEALAEDLRIRGRCHNHSM